jgi:hypothetical protein
MKWLDTHAGSVQAIAAVLTFVLTGVLAWFTRRYVLLTRAIADASAAQVEYAKKEANESLRRTAEALAALVARIREPLGRLQPSTMPVGKLIDYPHLQTADAVEVELLARALGGDAVIHAGKAVYALRQLADLIARVRATDPRIGWRALERDEQNWYESHQTALKELDELKQQCWLITASHELLPARVEH